MIKLIKAIIRFFNLKAEAAAGTVDSLISAEEKRLSIDSYVDELSARLGDENEMARIKKELEKPQLIEETIEYTSRGQPIYRYNVKDKYVELAKARVRDILDDID